MVGKKSGKALLREEGKHICVSKLEEEADSGSLAGLERTDNGMKQSSWPEVQMINQKNYYTLVPLATHRMPCSADSLLPMELC